MNEYPFTLWVQSCPEIRALEAKIVLSHASGAYQHPTGRGSVMVNNLICALEALTFPDMNGPKS
jgi:hypothetical protein